MSKKPVVNNSALLVVLVSISVLFLFVIARFLEALFLAGLFAAVFHPLYRNLFTWFRGRSGLAAIATLIIVALFVLIPISIILVAVASQAREIVQVALPELQNLLGQPSGVNALLQKLPFFESIAPWQEFLSVRLAEVIDSVSGALLGVLQSLTLGTVNAAVTGLIVVYSFVFLLMDGDRLVYLILYYLPMDDDHEQKLLQRFRSVTLATLKGTAVIGFLQGALAGAALWLAGIPNALLWSVAMMLMSVVPGIGAALIWIPAALYLVFQGQYITAAVVATFCGVLVGSIDNLLRPRLVGSDTQLHELMIFFSTLGGLLTFGMPGFIIGPIIAALFVTVWDIYAVEFRHWLPETRFEPHQQNPVQKPSESARSANPQQGAATDTDPDHGET